MNKYQLRHAHSIARHVLVHIEQLQRDMQSIKSLGEDDVKDYPVGKMEERIQRDVSHATKEIGQVLDDMLGELAKQ